MTAQSTPRVDAEFAARYRYDDFRDEHCVRLEFARILERDLTAALARAERLESALRSLETRLRAAEADRDATMLRLANQDDEMIALAAKLEDAERDAGRYRWLRGNGGPSSLRWPLWCVQHWTGHWNPVSEFEMDEAIDASIEQESKDGK